MDACGVGIASNSADPLSETVQCRQIVTGTSPERPCAERGSVRFEDHGTACSGGGCLGGTISRMNGMDAGADDYLTKPFQLPTLPDRICTAVQHRARVSPLTHPIRNAVSAKPVRPHRSPSGVARRGPVQAG
jgi:CheY-like chemotaxis protein